VNLTTSVKTCKDRPVLFINDQPHTGFMLYHGTHPEACGDIVRFAKSGVNLLSTCFSMEWITDFERVDNAMRAVIKANPDILVLPRFGLEPPAEWREQHPDDLMVHYKIATGEKVLNQRVAITSQAWRHDVVAVWRKTIEYMETHWGDHILGYHPGASHALENSYDWDCSLIGEYSGPQVRAFREWLKTRYHNDPARLQSAWNMPGLAFEEAEIPPPAWRMRGRDDMPLLDPARAQQVIDYQLFHSEAMADAVLHVCKAAKGALRNLGREKIVATFYAYHCWGSGPFGFNSGHHAHQRVLESPDVDVICAPMHYLNRHAGGRYADQVLPASLRLHGKLYYAEDDTGTHLPEDCRRPWAPDVICRDADVACEILRRNVLGVLQNGASQWWMDIRENGRYRDDKIAAEIARMVRFGEERLDRGYRSLAQVAVLASDTSMAYLRNDPNLINTLLDRQLDELKALGAPFDLYRVEDLEKLVQSPQLHDYRLIVFLDTVRITPRDMALIHGHLARNGRTLLWTFAPGLAQDGKWDVEFVNRLTGLRLQLHHTNRTSLLVETWLTGSRLAYGIDKTVGPILAAVDDDARVVGYKTEAAHGACTERDDDPGLLIKEMNGWRSIWSAAPGLPSTLLQHFARMAGVHLYAERGDQVFAGDGWLGIHACLDGDLEIRLPQEAVEVTEQRTGKVIARASRRFTVATRRGETLLWKLQ